MRVNFSWFFKSKVALSRCRTQFFIENPRNPSVYKKNPKKQIQFQDLNHSTSKSNIKDFVIVNGNLDFISQSVNFKLFSLVNDATKNNTIKIPDKRE